MPVREEIKPVSLTRCGYANGDGQPGRALATWPVISYEDKSSSFSSTVVSSDHSQSRGSRTRATARRLRKRLDASKKFPDIEISEIFNTTSSSRTHQQVCPAPRSAFAVRSLSVLRSIFHHRSSACQSRSRVVHLLLILHGLTRTHDPGRLPRQRDAGRHRQRHP
jgi:hypothetical protein